MLATAAATLPEGRVIVVVLVVVVVVGVEVVVVGDVTGNGGRRRPASAVMGLAGPFRGVVVVDKLGERGGGAFRFIDVHVVRPTLGGDTRSA